MSSHDAASNQLVSSQSEPSDFPSGSGKTLTASNGVPVDSLTASLTATGKDRNDQILLKDFTLIDHLSHFDRERIPERVVHAKGAGAFGEFVTTTDFAAKYCKAKMFSEKGKKVPVAVRFSTVGGESGSSDVARDPRGFAIKFYTEEGNWDLVGNNTPIFFLRDPILFPSFIHTQKRNPQTHLADANMFWDFISLRPETIHQVSFLFSDRGIPRGYRHMNGYGSHTFKNVNAKGEPVYVKYHLKTDQGISNFSAQEASEIKDNDFATRDLYNSIATQKFPSWTLYMQVMTFNQAKNLPFNPFDLTKIWSHKDFPLKEVGRMTLNRNPENYFAEVEQLAFSPSHLIPGVEPSPDKMLQARLFSYPDTHRHRLGVNYQQIPVNRPFNTTVNTYERDGNMNVGDNGSNGPNYFPNSFRGPSPQENSAKWHVDSNLNDVQRVDTGDEDNFTQCRTFFCEVLNDDERERLTSNIAEHIQHAHSQIRQRAINNFKKVHPKYATLIQHKVELSLAKNGSHNESFYVAPLNPPRSLPNVISKCPFGFSSKSKL